MYNDGETIVIVGTVIVLAFIALVALVNNLRKKVFTKTVNETTDKGPSGVE